MISDKKKKQDGKKPRPPQAAARRRDALQHQSAAAKKEIAAEKVKGRKTTNLFIETNVRFDYADGNRPNIMRSVDLVVEAAEASPLGLISIALAKGVDNTPGEPVYQAYAGFIDDLRAILTNRTSPTNGRLEYLHDILMSAAPKSREFPTGSIDYSWLQVAAVQASNAIVVRSYRYYLYVYNGATVGVWQVMVPPVPGTVDTQTTKLAQTNNILANIKVPHLRYSSKQLGKRYENDTSFYCAVSPYYGSGNSTAGASSFSIELEVPFKMPLCTGLATYAPFNGRVARCYRLGSGDSTAALSYGMLSGFVPKYYNSCYAPHFAPIDLDEVVVFLQAWYLQLAGLAQGMGGVVQGTEQYTATTQFAYSAQQFRIAVAACIRSMFSTSQSVAQFITYTDDVRGFEPLRMGTNCFGKVRTTMRIPNILLENLRMLMYKILKIPARFQSDKNAWLLIPVWGVYKGATVVNLEGFLNDPESGQGERVLFRESSEDDPNVIDGQFNGSCYNLNSPIVAEVITEWNDRVEALAQWAGKTGYMEGASTSSLLTLTRFCRYSADDAKIPMKSMSPYFRKQVPKSRVFKEKVTRSRSQTKGTSIIEEQEFYIPVNGSLYTQHTTDFVSVSPFTTAMKTAINYFIYPTVVLELGNVPQSGQYRTMSKQSSILNVEQEEEVITSRFTELQQFARACVPGIAAAGNDELASVLAHLTDRGEGGFIRDVAIALAGLIPI